MIKRVHKKELSDPGLRREVLDLKKSLSANNENLTISKDPRMRKMKQGWMDGSKWPQEYDLCHPPAAFCSDSNHQHFW
jgi:hypothetical protein